MNEEFVDSRTVINKKSKMSSFDTEPSRSEYAEETETINPVSLFGVMPPSKTDTVYEKSKEEIPVAKVDFNQEADDFEKELSRKLFSNNKIDYPKKVYSEMEKVFSPLVETSNLVENKETEFTRPRSLDRGVPKKKVQEVVKDTVKEVDKEVTPVKETEKEVVEAKEIAKEEKVVKEYDKDKLLVEESEKVEEKPLVDEEKETTPNKSDERDIKIDNPNKNAGNSRVIVNKSPSSVFNNIFVKSKNVVQDRLLVNRFEKGEYFKVGEFVVSIVKNEAMIMSYKGNNSSVRLPDSCNNSPVLYVNPKMFVLTENGTLSKLKNKFLFGVRESYSIELMEILLPRYLVKIPDGLFTNNCVADKIIIPPSVRSISEQCFKKTSIKDVIFTGIAPPDLYNLNMRNINIICLKQFALSFAGKCNYRTVDAETLKNFLEDQSNRAYSGANSNLYNTRPNKNARRVDSNRMYDDDEYYREDRRVQNRQSNLEPNYSNRQQMYNKRGYSTTNSNTRNNYSSNNR